MNCTDEVADAILTILREAVLRIRMAGNAGDADFCAIEANHIHNLPSLLRSFNMARLQRYLQYDRGYYVSQMKQERPDFSYEVYLPHWENLERYAQQDAG